jgi:hypothetical protein
MNIFYLHPDPVVCATHHCDKHVVKMILETAQLLSTAHRILDGDDHADWHGMYKATHKNHPSAVWVREAVGNYVWTHQLLISLCREYTHRYGGKTHKTERLVKPLSRPPAHISNKPFHTPIPQCMPDEYKDIDPVVAYRRYYINDKKDLARWDKTSEPTWFVSPEEYEKQGMNSMICV